MAGAIPGFAYDPVVYSIPFGESRARVFQDIFEGGRRRLGGDARSDERFCGAVSRLVVADSQPVIPGGRVVFRKDVARQIQRMGHDNVDAIVEQAHGLSRGRPGLENVADVIDALKFATARRVAPIINNVVAKIAIDQRAKPRVAALVVRDQVVVNGQPALPETQAQAMVGKIQPLAQDAPLHRNQVGHFADRHDFGRGPAQRKVVRNAIF